MRINILIVTLLVSTALLVANPKTKITEGQYRSSIPDNSISGGFEFSQAEDVNGYTFKMASNIDYSEAFFDKNMNFRSMNRTLYKNSNFNIIKLLKQDYFDVSISKNGKELIINYELEGKKIKTKKVKIKGDYRIFDNLFFTLQKDLQIGVKDFESFIIFPENATGYKASFAFYKTKNLLEKSPQYKNAPEFFVAGSEFNKDVIVCEVGLMGIASKFFPHKFSFVFENGIDYKFLGYWGGNPETPNYYIADNKTGDK